MRLEALVAALVLFGDLAGPAHADLRGQPQFSAAESQTIARNELLNAVVAADPWLVRRMLDIIAHENARGDAVRGTPSAADPDLSITPRDWQGIVDGTNWSSAREPKRKREKNQRPPPPAAPRRERSTCWT